MSNGTSNKSWRERLRRYSPLGVIAASLVITIFALPSVLNLPQTNPTEVAEYAPVPPDSDEAAPPGGNFSGLGLGGSPTLEGAPQAAPPPTDQGGGERSAFRCVVVDGVARQTEDPLSPPCVSSFEGDNGGSTYRGVSGKEINVVFYIACRSDANYAPTSRGQETPICDQYIDLDQPPSQDDFVTTRALKRLSVYFNSRFQTYDRHVHMWAFYGDYTIAAVGPGGCREDCRRTDAARTIEDRDPFAVLIDGGIADYMESYIEPMAKNGVLNFSGGGARRPAYYRKYPGLLWGYGPTIDQQADMYASYLCRQVVPHNVSFSGMSGDMGKKRKFGIIFSNRDGDPFYPLLKKLVVERIKKCGAGDMPEAGYQDQGTAGGDPAANPTKATQVQGFISEGVTTVLWMGPPNGFWGQQMSQGGYRPEIVVFGDGGMEDFVTGRYSEDAVWENAWVMSDVTLINRQEDQLCALALREVDPSFPREDIPWSCGYYTSLRQLFTGIQVAGPRITPQTVDQGFHAIPAVASTSPRVPACFYLPGDYTCVKDAISMYWDPDGEVKGWTGQGCYRVTEGGKRYLLDKWPRRDVTALRKSSDQCNGFTAFSSFSPDQQTG